MIDVALLIWILIGHYIADFLLQSRNVANNKSKDTLVLAKHVLIYTGFFFVWLYNPLIIFHKTSVVSYLFYVIINGILHFITDFVTSRISSVFFKREDYYKGFAIIGLDQLLHTITLILTLFFINI